MALPPIVLDSDLDALIEQCARNGISTLDSDGAGRDAQAMALELANKTKRQVFYGGPASTSSRAYQRQKGFS